MLGKKLELLLIQKSGRSWRDRKNLGTEIYSVPKFIYNNL